LLLEPAPEELAARQGVPQRPRPEPGPSPMPANDAAGAAPDPRPDSAAAAAFYSILFETSDDRPISESSESPAFFPDLNLDQIVEAIVGGKDGYDLKPFLHAPLKRLGAIEYRHQVFQDLEAGELLTDLEPFAEGMKSVREHLARIDKLYYQHQQEGWFLDAVELYCESVSRLSGDLATANLRSHGFLAFREYLANYTESDAFRSLVAETKRLKTELSTVQYAVTIYEDRFTVRKYDGETNYSVDVERSFEKFKQGAVTDYTVKFHELAEMNHIDAQILDFVALLYPDIFRELGAFRKRNASFMEDTLRVFDREMQFYAVYLRYVAAFRDGGLNVCYPVLSDSDKRIDNEDGFDFALANKLLAEHGTVVCNDFFLQGAERILVVSGPNQGGKTTFARTFGQLHYLASLGCPVAGSKARLFLFDRLFTHFEKEEDIHTLRGKLEDDLVRIRDIIRDATPRSIVIINEIFTSTALRDAIFLGKRVLQKIVDRDCLCVCVTFLDELSSLGPQTVSMASTVVADDPTIRTFKVVRRVADGLAYALSIAEKYGLTYARVKERIKP
jgi:hypothetical protein